MDSLMFASLTIDLGFVPIISAGDEVITLGNVSLQLKQPENPELVPVKYSQLVIFSYAMHSSA